MKYYKDLHNLYYKEVLKELEKKYYPEWRNDLIWFLAHDWNQKQYNYTYIDPKVINNYTYKPEKIEQVWFCKYKQDDIIKYNHIDSTKFTTYKYANGKNHYRYSVCGFRKFPLRPTYQKIYELLEPSAELGRFKAPYIEIMKIHNLPYTKNMSVATMKTRIIDFTIKKVFFKNKKNDLNA